MALLGPAVIGLTTGSAGAATQAGVVSAGAHVSPPKVKLVGGGSSVTFDPSSLTLVDKRNGGCSPAHGEWVITNKTSAKQVVLLFGHKFLSLEPSERADGCSGGSPGRYVMKLTLKSSPEAKLKVTVIVP
jgi:hypothetical protein